MKRLRNIILLLTLLGFVLPLSAGEYPGGDKKQKGMAKTTADDVFDFISINSILMYISNNGATAHNPKTDASGLEWPRGGAKYAIFTDGLIWGGTVQGEVRVGGATYRYGLQAGPIKADGSAADPSDPRYTIYKVRKVSEETFPRLTAEEQARLRNDFEKWPIADGAPWVDKNKNGAYEPDFDDWLVEGENSASDTPWFIGDEVIWFVSNDLNPSRTSNLYGTAPIGIEVHTLLWGYEQTGPLGNMIFTKYTIINKGVNDLENAFLAKWSDPDLGDANDDLVGIDTNLVLGYTYNGFAKDGIYGVPPSTGYDFFQGPIVPADPSDVAHYNFGLRQGFKNLGVSSFAFYINGDNIYRDPVLGQPQGATQMYNYMNSRLYAGNPFIDPTTGLQSKVCLSGDPITKTGWTDGLVHPPGDRRILMTTGPFTLAQSDTQEIVVATIVGRGSDRLSSLQVLKYYDRFAQKAFDENFDLPKSPPAPVVQASRQPKEIVLHWGNPQSSAVTENFEDRGYKFQGYNVYQFPSKSSTLAEAKRIATFDKVDNIATIFDEVIDDRSGAVVTLPVQFGVDAGLVRSIKIDRDYLIDRPLVNNQPYYYAVTAYSYIPNEDAPPPRTLESNPVVIEVRPQTNNPGWRYGIAYDTDIEPQHVSGFSTGVVEVKVIDPMLLTGGTYEVTFDSVGIGLVYDGVDSLPFPQHAWNLTRIRAGSAPALLVNKAKDFKGLEYGFYSIDGFIIAPKGAGLPDYEHPLQSVEWIGGPPVYEEYVEWETAEVWGWGSSLLWHEINKTVEIRFSKTNTSKGYNYRRGASPIYGYQGYFDCPFTVWDISNPANERQLAFVFIEQQGSATANNTWDPISADAREYLFILDETYEETPKAEYTTRTFLNDAPLYPIMYASWLIHNQAYPTNPPWREGDKYRITPKVPFTSADLYRFTTTPPSFTNETAAQDVAAINVFPNPYYGANAQELNKYQRFVTFNHLPQRAKFRVYTLSGTLVKSFEKNDASQIINWDLHNENGLPVASGVYIIHIDMPDLGVEKILKLGVVSETQFLDRI